MHTFTGKTAVITGAAAGIGLAFVERFLHEGMQVVMADIDAVALETQALRLQAAGHPVASKVTDVTSETSLEALADFASARFGNIHLLCNNAGIGGGAADDKSLWEASVADWKWVLDINVWGVIHGLRVFTPRMIAHGEVAHIINTASKAGLLSGTSLYASSKHTVVAITEALYAQLRLAKTKVGASVLCPGGVNTNLSANSSRMRPLDALTPQDAAPNEENKSTAATHFMKTYQHTVQTRMAAGKAPADIAEMLVQGLHAGDFYIMPSKQEDAPILARCQNIQARKIEDLGKSFPQFSW